MKTLIVSLYPYQGKGLDSWIDHGAGMTYTAAKQSGCDVSFLDMKTLTNDKELKVALTGYDLIAISMKSSYYAIGMRVIKYAKELGSLVIVGGYHATAAPNELLNNPEIDYIFKGESELTFPKFLKDHLMFKRSITGEKPKDLNLLPFVDRSIYTTSIEDCTNWWYGGKLTKMTSVCAARGCPYHCAFCQPLENNHFGKALRRRSVDSVISELKQLVTLYNPECLMIHDDTFLLQRNWLEEFIDKYPEIGLPFWASGRADGICKNPDLVQRLVDIGWDLISVGFESGSQRILDKLKKGITVEQNLESAKIIKSTGAKIYANYITAIPWETKWDIQATSKMADEIDAEMPSWAYFAPYPGCELGEYCIEKGWSLLNQETYDRCPSGEKVKHVDYNYVSKVRQGLREDPYPIFCDIIIPAYNNEHYSIECLNSIKDYTEPGTYRVIFVDNASTKESLDKVKEVLSGIEHLLIQMPTNEGFVGAINKGLESSSAPNVCLLNNDTIVSKEWLKKLVDHLASSKDLGIIGALTNYGKGNAVDSHHSLSLHSSLLPEEAVLWKMGRVNEYLESHYYNRTTTPPFVAFLCAVIKRGILDIVGHLDPNYAMGMWDDLDYNRGVRAAGYRTELALNTCIQHFGRSTFNIVQTKEGFDVDSLLKTNKAYLDKKWKGKLDPPITSDPSIPTKVLTAPIIISRAIYNTMGEGKGIGILTESRLALMQKYFINSLKSQTDKDFSISLVVGDPNNETTQRIKSLDWTGLNINFIHTTSNLSEWESSISRSRNWGQEKDKGSPEYIAKNSSHPISTIMARLDTDDWVAPGWIAHIKHMTKTKPETHFIINYQLMGQAPDGRLYNFYAKHTHARTSPFLVLVQKVYPYISPYEDIHLNMGSKFSTVYTIPPSYVFMVVHGENRSNRLYRFDQFFEDMGEEVFIRPELKPVLIHKEKLKSRTKPSSIGSSWQSRIQAVK